MFQTTAMEVLRSGAAARDEALVFSDLKEKLKKGRVKSIIKKIINLQQRNGSITIINNTNLSRMLQDLADTMVISLSNANQMAGKLLTQPNQLNQRNITHPSRISKEL